MKTLIKQILAEVVTKQPTQLEMLLDKIKTVPKFSRKWWALKGRISQLKKQRDNANKSNAWNDYLSK